MTNTDVKELFSRYMNIENEIKMLQEDKKQMVKDVISDDEQPSHLTSDELAGLLDD